MFYSALFLFVQITPGLFLFNCFQKGFFFVVVVFQILKYYHWWEILLWGGWIWFLKLGKCPSKQVWCLSLWLKDPSDALVTYHRTYNIMAIILLGSKGPGCNTHVDGWKFWRSPLKCLNLCFITLNCSNII